MNSVLASRETRRKTTRYRVSGSFAFPPHVAAVGLQAYFVSPLLPRLAWAYDLLQPDPIISRVDFIQAVLNGNGITSGALPARLGTKPKRPQTTLRNRGRERIDVRGATPHCINEIQIYENDNSRKGLAAFTLDQRVVI